MTNSYHNPVYHRDFPDPFVLKYCGEYWAYCTGFWHDGRCFGILHSRDLVHWSEQPGAMAPLPSDATCYWAPEVAYDNGRFYLYYSVGNEERMQIRVAVATHPAGPFEDSGHRLTHEPFAIDAHPFRDENGERYLFYATDFLDHERIGTGTVRDRMLDPFTLEGNPQPVTRACYDWQIYDPQREEKGGVCWHTVEGPFVLHHKQRYYQMFSGGNWQNPSYGVSYATASSIEQEGEWQQHCDGEEVLPILRTLAGEVIGPGHNSVVVGPDNRQLFCVYHRWAEDGSGRLLAIDRLEWVGERMVVLGPSNSPQLSPLSSTFVDFFDTPHASGLGPNWSCEGGQWSVHAGAAVQEASEGAAEAHCLASATSFLAEVSVRAGQESSPDSAYGIALHGPRGSLLRVQLVPPKRQLRIAWRSVEGWRSETLPLPPDFEPAAYHTIELEVDQQQVRVALDGPRLRWEGILETNGPSHLSLFTHAMTATFAGVAITSGWQDQFVERADPTMLGWRAHYGIERWRIQDQQLYVEPGAEPSILTKGPLLAAYELVVNVRLDGPLDDEIAYSIYPAVRELESGPRLDIVRDAEGWTVQWQDRDATERFALPEPFDPTMYQQFRLRKAGDRMTIQWEATLLGEAIVVPHPARVGLSGGESTVAYDLVRVTALEPEEVLLPPKE